VAHFYPSEGLNSWEVPLICVSSDQPLWFLIGHLQQSLIIERIRYSRNVKTLTRSDYLYIVFPDFSILEIETFGIENSIKLKDKFCSFCSTLNRLSNFENWHKINVCELHLQELWKKSILFGQISFLDRKVLKLPCSENNTNFTPPSYVSKM